MTIARAFFQLVPDLQPSRCVVMSLRLLFLLPAGLPVRSQGESQSDSKQMDNITIRQGETLFLR
uniref:Uncharacterized protein n=1 Tax=Sinocyclocheilus grahami TaxID=75366 RepID=A0A672LPR5_SINGR